MDKRILDGMKAIVAAVEANLQLDCGITAIRDSIVSRGELFEKKKTEIEKDIRRGSRLSKHRLPL